MRRTLQFFADLRELAKERLHEPEQLFTRGSEFEWPSLIEDDAEISLKRIDLRADGRLLNSVWHLPRGSAYPFAFGHVVEKFQLVGVHID
jgi:hypothetical protein